MQVILLEKIRNLGNLGETVKVKPGYGRNYLLPQRKAVQATPKNLEIFAARRAELEQRAAEKLQAAQARAAQIAALGAITIAAKVADESKLYGSIGIIDIVESLTKAGVTVEKSEVHLPTGSIRMTGEHDISLHLHSDVTATVKVIVVPE